MAIEKFTTRALILEHYASGENDIMIKAFTEEFGVINILAKSLRKREGKLKAHVRKYHYANLVLVRGREIWRLSGASEIIVNNSLTPEISKFVARLYRGEQAAGPIFKKLYEFLADESLGPGHNDIGVCKVSIYAILLIDLGYMDATVLGINSIEEYHGLESRDIVLYVGMHKNFINNAIRNSLRESML